MEADLILVLGFFPPVKYCKSEFSNTWQGHQMITVKVFKITLKQKKMIAFSLVLTTEATGGFSYQK